MAAAQEGHVFHNRLTHVLKVAQIARGIAEALQANPSNEHLIQKLGGLDPDVVETAALAHDLGHPPFGHTTEKELDHLAMQEGLADGFEGNAQSFRVITKLAVRTKEHGLPGLNLTQASLNAVLKYPWFRSTGTDKKSRKWGAYRSEQKDFEFAREGFECDETKSLEAEIMDWADDVAYSVFDMEDFYKARKVPLERIFDKRLPDISVEGQKFLEAAFQRWNQNQEKRDPEQIRTAFKHLGQIIAVDGPFEGWKRQRGALRGTTSFLITRYIRALELDAEWSRGKPRVKVQPDAQNEVAILKELTWQYVIRDSALLSQQYGFRKIIGDLFGILGNAASTPGEWEVFPKATQEFLREATNCQELVRMVIDLIASMTEQQAISMHQRLTGISAGSILRPIL